MRRKSDTYESDSGREANRVSQTPGLVMLSAGGVGFLARRGMWPSTNLQVTTLEGISALALNNPLYLISLLPDVVGEFGAAVWNFLRLGCAPGAVRLKAMTTASADGAKGKAGAAPAKSESPDGTALIDMFFESLPDEIAGLTGALSQQMQMVLFYGMSALEAVPGPQGTGLKEMWPIDPISLDFKRETDGSLGLYQRQVQTQNGLFILPYAASLKPLPMNRTFWAALDPVPGNPYGRAPFAPALSEVLICLAFMRDLTLAWHRMAYPRLDVAFDFEMCQKVAQELVELNIITDARKYVRDKFKQAQDDAIALTTDDIFFHSTNAKVGITGAGDQWPDIPGIYAIFRSKLILALKQLPVMMGINDSTTETWANTQWRIWTAGMQSIQRATVEPIRRALGLHFRLLERTETVEIEYEPIRTNQRLIDAQAEAQEILNEQAKYYFGAETHDEACLHLTGSEAVAEPLPDPNKASGGIGASQGSDASGSGPKPGSPTSPGGGADNADGTAKAISVRLSYYAKVAANRARVAREAA